MVNPQSTAHNVPQVQLNAFSEEQRTDFYKGKALIGGTDWLVCRTEWKYLQNLYVWEQGMHVKRKTWLHLHHYRTQTSLKCCFHIIF